MAKTTKPRLSTAEKEAIVEGAFSLIEEPANWTHGTWKCPVYKTDEKGHMLKDESGHPIPEYDRYNRPLAQYCIEGAVNQASFNVLGETRARRFGVREDNSDMTERLGLDELTRKLYPDYECAMDYNDGARSHEGIVTLLQTRLKELRTKLRR